MITLQAVHRSLAALSASCGLLCIARADYNMTNYGPVAPYSEPSRLVDALAYIDQNNAQLHDEIAADINSGAVDVAEISGTGFGGMSDADTVALDKSMDMKETAATLVHEWHHIKQMRGYVNPSGVQERDISAACQEFYAYNAELAFYCSLMLEPPPWGTIPCSIYEAAQCHAEEYLLDCTPPPEEGLSVTSCTVVDCSD